MITYKILEFLRKVYSKLIGTTYCMPNCIKNVEEASILIRSYLKDDEPCMIARYGATELRTIVNYLSVSQKKHNYVGVITGQQEPWWWLNYNISNIKELSGFYPNDYESVSKFCKLQIEDSSFVDVLGSWRHEEFEMEPYLGKHEKVDIVLLEPFFSSHPWTEALAGKRVVVVHPFAELIYSQYKKRNLIFPNKEILPEFDLRVVKAVQSLGGECSDYSSWFEALEWMKEEMDKEPYDIALIGCGAYGFSLAAHSKRTGHKAIHIGGALQLLFGIKGNRWENPKQSSQLLGREGAYLEMFNEYWVYPSSEYRPKNADKVEGATYWKN